MPFAQSLIDCGYTLTTWYSGERYMTIMVLLFHNVFHSYVSLVCQNAALCGNGLNFYQTTRFGTLLFENIFAQQMKCTHIFLW